MSTAARGSGERRLPSSEPGALRLIANSVRSAPSVTSTSAAAAGLRDRTSSQKRVSDRYCAIPSARANGSDPRLRSCGRQPSIVVSSVTTIASHPTAAARARKESTSSSSVLQYSWNQRGESPITAAQSSIDHDAWLENTYGSPRAAAALAIARSPSGCSSSDAPTGANSTGAGIVRPNSSTLRARAETSRSIRGTIAQRSNAARLARIVAPSPAPPAQYAHARDDAFALRPLLQRLEVRGNTGRRPSAPSR